MYLLAKLYQTVLYGRTVRRVAQPWVYGTVQLSLVYVTVFPGVRYGSPWCTVWTSPWCTVWTSPWCTVLTKLYQTVLYARLYQTVLYARLYGRSTVFGVRTVQYRPVQYRPCSTDPCSTVRVVQSLVSGPCSTVFGVRSV